MDKRFKWPLKQRANHSEAPYHHNPSRGGYPRHPAGHPMQPSLHPHPHQLGHPNQHPGKRNARQHYGYKGYRKPLPPPPPPMQAQMEQMGGGAMPPPPPSSGGSVGATADVVTVIVENNNLKRMIVLHLKLLQEQTDSLTAKEKELDEQSAKMGMVMAQNQELKQAVQQLEAANEELRKQLRRKNQRRHDDDDDDDDDHALPPAVPQQKIIRCHAETQTVIREREQCTQTMEAMEPQLAEVQPRILSVEELPPVPHLVAAVANLPSGKRSESKGRGEFNGKKVSTFILQRMNQDSKHHIHEEQTQVEEQAHEEQLQLEEVQLQMQEVQAEEVVGGDIFHDALETFDVEVVTEELVELEEQTHAVDANGHMEEEEDEEDQDEENENSEEDDEDEDDQSVDSETDVHFRNEDDLWPNQINSMELDTTAEKAVAPSAHSTPNHQQKYLPQAEVRKEPLQEWKPEKRLHEEPETKVDQKIEAADQMEVDRVEEANLALKTLQFLKESALKEKETAQEKVVQLAEIRKDEAAIKQKEKDHEKVVGMAEIRKEPQSHLFGAANKEKENDQEKGVELAEEAAAKQKEKVPEKGAELTEKPKEPQRHHHDGATEDHKAIKKQEPTEDDVRMEPAEDALKEQIEAPKKQRMEQAEDVLKEQADAPKTQPQDSPKQAVKAAVPKVAAVPSPSIAETKLPKANNASSSAHKPVANHQSTKTQTEPVKKKRLQVNLRQHEMFSGNKTNSSTPLDPRKHKNSDPAAGPETKIAKQATVNDKRTAPERSQPEDQDLEQVEAVKRKLHEHLRKELLSQSQLNQIALKKTTATTTIRERTVTNLIYPPPSAPLSSTTITPAPTPSTTPTPTSSMETETSASKSKSKAAEQQIATPLTPQSNSSVSSSASTTRKTLNNNCSPHTYSRATARSGKSKSRFRTATFPYSTRTWEDQDIHCDNEFFLEEADELLADNPSLEIPKWKDVPVMPSEDKSGTEPLDDAVFERRHQKYVKDEIDRKCRDARYMKEQLRLEGLRNRRNQDEVLVTLDPLPTSTFYPLPEDIEGVQIVTEVTVQAFGENMVNMEARDDFGVAWVDAVEAPTSIARSKALAEPVATLASKKLPTTAAEARHQENHSSYVFPKRRKRQKNR
ncbi:protein male-specific lethal-1 [Drosophila takahashii]|uniref:protein male-specific lethal-1 n=1 Tax=Drosophila takahashii TaxID=29030 RepID=UPI001CF8C5CC|nr:protein male-specific lethal-1 [Drosophila takahashii]